ncbi:hypothetical protein Y032_0268g788 [Ancylostoma ceylanicum]|uniref:Uncharacterized protein n=1 Tax=Ancylostoma ceylanicum TaxID=53326 RepID=A0A016S916_9BILA|nr:hypothetical protein Y032_0268g788 [Ancylostoma ceylanicum]
MPYFIVGDTNMSDHAIHCDSCHSIDEWDAATPPCTEVDASTNNSAYSSMELGEPLEETVSETQSFSSRSEAGALFPHVTRVTPLQIATPTGPAPTERYLVTVKFARQSQGELLRSDCDKKVYALVQYLRAVIRRADTMDDLERDFGTRLSDQVKAEIMQAITGYITPEEFSDVMEEIFKVRRHDRTFVNFLKKAFPRLTRCLINGDLAIDPFIPGNGLYEDGDYVDVVFDAYFLFRVHRELYERLVQNGTAPPIPPHIAGALTDYEEFDSDSESTTVEGISEMEEVVPLERDPHPCFDQPGLIPAHASDGVGDVTVEVSKARISYNEEPEYDE